MNQNINLRDGEIAVVIGDASVIMNVNTAFEVFAKLFKSEHCSNNNDDADNADKDEDLDSVCHSNKNNQFINISEYLERLERERVQEVKPSTGSSNDKVPVLAFAFDTKKANKFNDLRAGVGDYPIRRFDSMSDADTYYQVAAGTASRVVNTWLPYVNYTGPMNPMSGDVKNYRFSSKYNGKSLRWNFTPFYNNVKGVERIVLFREDALPKFIIDRNIKKNRNR